MMMALLLSFWTLLFTAGAIKTEISDANMTNLLKSDHLTLAKNNAPVWFFGQEGTTAIFKEPPCIPCWAYSGTDPLALGPDVYNSESRTKPVARCVYPKVGCGCRNPPQPVGQASGAWPIYYTIKECPLNNPPDIRVNYNVFYQKDGISPGKLGHDWYDLLFRPSPLILRKGIDPKKDVMCVGWLTDVVANRDWERVVVVFGAKQVGTEKVWDASHFLLSKHGGYYKFPWGYVQNTLT